MRRMYNTEGTIRSLFVALSRFVTKEKWYSKCSMINYAHNQKILSCLDVLHQVKKKIKQLSCMCNHLLLSSSKYLLVYLDFCCCHISLMMRST